LATGGTETMPKLKELEEAVMGPRTKGRTKLIRKAFKEYKESLKKPWWKFWK